MAGAGRGSSETMSGTQASPSALAPTGKFAGKASQPMAPAHLSYASAASKEIGSSPSRSTSAHGDVTISHLWSPREPSDGPRLSSSVELATLGEYQDFQDPSNSPGIASAGRQSATFLNPFATDVPRGFHSTSAESAGCLPGGSPHSDGQSGAAVGRGVSRRSNSGGSTGSRASGSTTPLRRCELTSASVYCEPPVAPVDVKVVRDRNRAIQSAGSSAHAVSVRFCQERCNPWYTRRLDRSACCARCRSCAMHVR